MIINILNMFILEAQLNDVNWDIFGSILVDKKTEWTINLLTFKGLDS